MITYGFFGRCWGHCFQWTNLQLQNHASVVFHWPTCQGTRCKHESLQWKIQLHNLWGTWTSRLKSTPLDLAFRSTKHNKKQDKYYESSLWCSATANSSELLVSGVHECMERLILKFLNYRCWHPNFDVVKGMVTDYLHCVMIGVTFLAWYKELLI